jgi:hypothetical protein
MRAPEFGPFIKGEVVGAARLLPSVTLVVLGSFEWE